MFPDVRLRLWKVNRFVLDFVVQGDDVFIIKRTLAEETENLNESKCLNLTLHAFCCELAYLPKDKTVECDSHRPHV